MNGQRGSILASVVGFSVVITAALGGFLVLAGNSARFGADSETETRLHYAAESAMAMGLRWLRTYPGTKTQDALWPTAPVVLNSATNGFTLMDGVWVKVVFLASPGEYQLHKLRCYATLGPGRDTLETNYYLALTTQNQEDEAGTTLYGLTMAQWRQTIHPGR
jgi:hypothetical protein